MLVQKRVQLERKDIDFIEKFLKSLDYKSQSEYFRIAISEKIKEDRKKIKEMKRKKAMEAYKKTENFFETMEGDDFECM